MRHQMRVVVVDFTSPPPSLLGLADIVYQWTPHVSLRGEESLFAEISQCSSLYSEREFLQRLRLVLEHLHLSPRIGVGEDPALALCHSRFHTTNRHHIPIAALLDFLNPFSQKAEDLKRLRPLLNYLEKLGLKTLQDFLWLNPKDLASRFGPSALEIYHHLRDGYHKPWPLFKPQEEIRESKEFATEFVIENVEPILFLLQSFFQSIELRLQARGQSLKAFEVRLLLETTSLQPKPWISLPMELTLNSISNKILLQIVREKIDHYLLKNPLPSRLIGVEVVVTETTPLVAVQKDLFQPKREETQEEYAKLINRISLKIGGDKVYKPKLQESYLPEKNWQVTESKVATPTQDPLPLRPLKLFRQPLRLYAHNQKLRFQNEEIDLLQISNGEVILSDWWNDSLERIYFQAQSATGQRYWIFKSQNQYFVHGIFD